MELADRMLLSGDEAVALAALEGGVALGTGYPGTPSTEILEAFSKLGGRAQWAPNEKVALEVGLGAAYGGAAALVTMKHVGLNVAADPLFTAAYTGVTGQLVVISADDPGMASSQNEQDNRHYAEAAGVPMLEPADSQEAYDFLRAALEISRRWGMPVLLRMTTRVCHSKSIVKRGGGARDCRFQISDLKSQSAEHRSQISDLKSQSIEHRSQISDLKSQSTEYTSQISDLKSQNAELKVHNLETGAMAEGFKRDIPGRVMIPAYARVAHRKLRRKLAEIGAYGETSNLNVRTEGDKGLGIITAGVTYVHAAEAAPGASVLKLGLTYPLPMEAIRAFAASVKRCVVVEEGDPWMANAIRAAGIAVESKAEMYRFGELNVGRVRRILAKDTSAEVEPPKGKPPQLCVSCPYHAVFQTFKDLDCIVAGDIGCYTLGVLPPYQAMDTCVCMGASLGVGLGLRHVLPEKDARRVVSVIGDSTFVHSGISGLVEMVYNPPATGHVLVILDNGTTAMTGQQEHPGTGRTLEHAGTNKVRIEELIKAIGIKQVVVTDPMADVAAFATLLRERLASNELSVIIARRPCLLAAGKIKEYERAAAAAAHSCEGCAASGTCGKAG